jgi:acyl-homoserine lactone acylase PvdQ
MTHARAFAVVAGLMCVSASPSRLPTDDLAARVTIYRDTYGIPHVFGETDASTMFGFAYAQAEDNFWRLEDNYIRAVGRRAEVEGEQGLVSDRRNRTLEIPRLARAEYSRMPRGGRMRALLDAFAAGLNAYVADHPDVRPRLLTRFEPWYPLAFIRYNYYQGGFFYSSGIRQGDLETGLTPFPPLPSGEGGLSREDLGSNGWVIGPSKSATGHSMQFINPHMPFFGPGQVYGPRPQQRGLEFHRVHAARFSFPVRGTQRVPRLGEHRQCRRSRRSVQRDLRRFCAVSVRQRLSPGRRLDRHDPGEGRFRDRAARVHVPEDASWAYR